MRVIRKNKNSQRERERESTQNFVWENDIKFI